MTIRCLFCDGTGPFSTVEHVIPESLGNDDFLLRGEVCDQCQRYFGKEVEKYVLEKTPIAVWRALLGIQSKKGKLPSIDMSISERRRGILPEYSRHHDNGVGFTAEEDGSTSVHCDDATIEQKIVDQSRTQLRFVLSPKHLVLMGRFLGKIAIEMYCVADTVRARLPRYDQLRQYARQGLRRDIWPIFHRNVGSLRDLREYEADEDGVLEHSLCYQYCLAEGPSGYELFSLRVGTDQWVICTNDPFPTPIIRDAFPNGDLKLIWYAREEWT